MDVDKLVAGPVLDSLIAETVMGWKPSKDGRYWEGPNVSRHREDGPELDAGESVWSPSWDIAAAWEVVEKLKLSLIPTNKGWIVSQHHLFEGPVGEATDAPLAICRAALKAIQITL